MLNDLFAVAITSAVGVVLGAVMIRQPKRRAEQVYLAAMDELRRASAEHPRPIDHNPPAFPINRVAAE